MRRGQPLLLLLLLQLLLLLLLLPAALSAKYGEICYSPEDCNTKEAPICQFVFADKTYMYNKANSQWNKPAEDTKPRLVGLCVECISDCDCALDKYCGVDENHPVVMPSNLTSQNTGSGLTNKIKLLLEAYVRHFSKLPLRSKCKKYELPTTCSSNKPPGAYAESVLTHVLIEDERQSTSNIEYSTFFQTRVPWGTPKRAESKRGESFCGKVNSWAPAFFPVIDLNPAGSKPMQLAIKWNHQSDTVSTKGYYNTPATCTPFVILLDPKKTVCTSCEYKQDCLERTDDFCCASASSYSPTTRTCYMYRDCEDACQPHQPSVSGWIYSYMCESMSMTAEQSIFCACYQTCLTCVTNHGGCAASNGICAPCPQYGGNPTGSSATCRSMSVTSSTTYYSYQSQRQPLDFQSIRYMQCLVDAARNSCTTDGPCPDSLYEIHISGECSQGDFHFDNGYFMFSFESPAIDFEGDCRNGECRICRQVSSAVIIVLALGAALGLLLSKIRWSCKPAALWPKWKLPAWRPFRTWKVAGKPEEVNASQRQGAAASRDKVEHWGWRAVIPGQVGPAARGSRLNIADEHSSSVDPTSRRERTENGRAERGRMWREEEKETRRREGEDDGDKRRRSSREPRSSSTAQSLERTQSIRDEKEQDHKRRQHAHGDERAASPRPEYPGRRTSSHEVEQTNSDRRASRKERSQDSESQVDRRGPVQSRREGAPKSSRHSRRHASSTSSETDTSVEHVQLPDSPAPAQLLQRSDPRPRDRDSQRGARH
ncbi:hypothetical protein GUITHDRAFT_140016 [Guillardia theta CCMP2712]|uniref:Apple domain-containing protein n=1 Tax=Guillardia theta (strain CCMP2712) TaxID=905079 RepID=L1J7Y2_GUITC|nr:hypothetical protein GUITHDRAFT_140016 [Guillardia theta CCMP2712]EKX44185.1 hypothetical protein GUITHDRAFT_140016 [Guillardia theta CCMP2712]|eukprot:XP_005831165.1 hypothetical protein GUITHDRAFT_140016 [Guillardia theta CCMP2712]